VSEVRREDALPSELIGGSPNLKSHHEHESVSMAGQSLSGRNLETAQNAARAKHKLPMHFSYVAIHGTLVKIPAQQM